MNKTLTNGLRVATLVSIAYFGSPSLDKHVKMPYFLQIERQLDINHSARAYFVDYPFSNPSSFDAIAIPTTDEWVVSICERPIVTKRPVKIYAAPEITNFKLRQNFPNSQIARISREQFEKIDVRNFPSLVKDCIFETEPVNYK